MADKFLTILQAIIFLKDGMNQFEVMTKLNISAKDVLFAEELLESLNKFSTK